MDTRPLLGQGHGSGASGYGYQNLGYGYQVVRPTRVLNLPLVARIRVTKTRPEKRSASLVLSL